MYDQLAVLSPVMLALTAATPILKGRLVDTDVRWNTIATSVDDRTPAERGLLDGHPVRPCAHSWMCWSVRSAVVLNVCCEDSVLFGGSHNNRFLPVFCCCSRPNGVLVNCG